MGGGRARRRRLATAHRHARRVRVELVVRLDLRGRRVVAEQVDDVRPSLARAEELLRVGERARLVDVAPRVLAVDGLDRLVDLCRRCPELEVRRPGIRDVDTSDGAHRDGPIGSVLDRGQRHRVGARDLVVGLHGQVGRGVRSAVDDCIVKLIFDGNASHIEPVRVLHRDRAAQDDVPCRGAGLRDVDLPLHGAGFALLHVQLALVDRFLDVPVVDLLPGRVGRLRDDEVLDTRAVLRVEAEVDMADPVRTRVDVPVLVDGRRDPRVGVVASAPARVVVVDHRVRAALHDDGRDVVEVQGVVEQRPAQRPFDRLVQIGDLDDGRTPRRPIGPTLGEGASSHPERHPSGGRRARIRVPENELVGVRLARVCRPVIGRRGSCDRKCRQHDQDQAVQERPSSCVLAHRITPSLSLAGGIRAKRASPGTLALHCMTRSGYENHSFG